MTEDVKILVRVFADEQTILQKLSKFEFIGQDRMIDTYYYDPLRPDFRPDATGRLNPRLRLRRQDGMGSLTYKTDHFNGDEWVYSDRVDLDIDDVYAIHGILYSLGLRELVTVDTFCRIYRAGDYTVVLQDIADLGLFLCVECCADTAEIGLAQVKRQMQYFVDTLGLPVSAALNASKPELMLSHRVLSMPDRKPKTFWEQE